MSCDLGLSRWTRISKGLGIVSPFSLGNSYAMFTMLYLHRLSTYVRFCTSVEGPPELMVATLFIPHT
jgi:hypothetical protein